MMVINRRARLSVTVLALVLLSAVQAPAASPPCRPRPDCQVTISVPSATFPTIQAAIEAVPENGDTTTILIAPGRYREQLFVVNKRVRLVGSSARGGTTLVGDLPREIGLLEDVVGLINYAGRGGGQVEHLRLEGGDAAIVGRASDREAGLTLRDVHVSGAGRGIVWGSPAAFTGKNLTIQDTLGNGAVITKGTFSATDFSVLYAKKVGLYIADAEFVLNNVQVFLPANEGIFFTDSVGFILNSAVFGATSAGIWAKKSDVYIENTSVSETYLHPIDDWSHGLRLFVSDVILYNNWFGHNEFGTINFGSGIYIAKNTWYNNVFHLAGDDVPSACSPPPPLGSPVWPFSYDDGGANKCGGPGGTVVCQISTPCLLSPEPIPPTN